MTRCSSDGMGSMVVLVIEESVCMLLLLWQGLFADILNNSFMGLPADVIRPYKGVEVFSLLFKGKDSPIVVLCLVRQGVAILQGIYDEVVSPSLEAEAGNKVIVYFHSVRMLGQF